MKYFIILILIFFIRIIAFSQNEDYMSKGEFRFHIGDYQQAVKMFTKAIEEDSTNIDAYIFRAKVYMYDEEYDSALVDIHKAEQIDSTNIEVFMIMGKLYYIQKKYYKAAKAYEQGAIYEPKHNKIFYNIGLCYYKKRNYIKAIENLDQAIAYDPDHSMSYKIRGLAKYMNNDRIDGCADLEMAKSLGAKGLDNILQQKCYKMNFDSLGGENWVVIKNQKIIDKNNAGEIKEFNPNDPQSVAMYFYASKISGNNKWKKVIPKKKEQAIKLKNTLSSYKKMKFTKYNVVKSKKVDDKTLILSVFFEFLIDGKTNNNVGNIIFKQNDSGWFLYDLPLIENQQ